MNPLTLLKSRGTPPSFKITKYVQSSNTCPKGKEIETETEIGIFQDVVAAMT